MTSESSLYRVTDVFGEDTSARWGEGLASNIGIRAIGWLTTAQGPRIAHSLAWRRLIDRVTLMFPEYCFYILAINSAPQPDTRIARYRKFWGGLTAGGLRVPEGKEIASFVLVSDATLRFTSVLRVELEASPIALEVVELERECHLIAVDGGNNAEKILVSLAESGWITDRWLPSVEVVRQVCAANGLVFWPVGQFDDRESGMAVVGRAALVDLLFDRHE
jgi:hypothetical protein